jgi:hypothetical protein
MTILHKQLARCAGECRQLDTDRWHLALTNGHKLSVSARRDDGFLLLDADTGLSPEADRWIPLAEHSAELPAAVKFALCHGGSTVRLRAEFPLPEDGVVEDRIPGNLRGMQDALGRLHELVSSGAPAVPADGPHAEDGGQAVPGGLADVMQETGWACHERPGGALLADLESGSQFLQAEVLSLGNGARFRVTLCRDDDTAEVVQQALCRYLLEANAALRFVRGFFERNGGTATAGFEVRLDGVPTPAEAGHALSALSVACRHCAREMEVLKDVALAGLYGSARGLPLHVERSLANG